MGHLTPRNYSLLQKRMDRFVPGVPASKALYELLRILFTDEEAKLCSVMPMSFFAVERIAKIWKKNINESEIALKALADKGLVYNFKQGDREVYALAAPVLGFFEFSLMRLDGKFDREKLSKLYYQYINIENDFPKEFASVYPQVSRVLVQEETLDVTSEILPYEQASAAIDSARCITVGTCFCRHKMEHMGMACDNPQDVCLTFNDMAEHVAKHGIARIISKTEAHAILDLCIKRGLVQIADNLKGGRAIICNCCGCCCDLLLGYKKLGISHSINPSNYIATVIKQNCSGCALCVKKCPVEAISLVNKKAVVDCNLCLGCGVCARFCPSKACRMEIRTQRPFVPENIFERLFLGSVQQGKLGNFVFDDQTSLLHRLLGNLLNAIVRLPSVKKFLLNEKTYTFLLRSRLGQAVCNK